MRVPRSKSLVTRDEKNAIPPQARPARGRDRCTSPARPTPPPFLSASLARRGTTHPACLTGTAGN